MHTTLSTPACPGQPGLITLPAVRHSGRWLALPGGRSAWLRTLAPDDAPALQAYVAGLSATSRRLRFHGGLKGLSPALAAQFCRSPSADAGTCAVWLQGADGSAPLLIGEARWVRSAWGCSAEFGLSVADAWQGQGIAQALLDELVASVQAAGVHRLVGDVLAHNPRMRSLLARMGYAEQDGPDGDTVRCVRDLRDLLGRRDLRSAAPRPGTRAAPAGPSWWSLLAWCLSPRPL